LVPGAFFFLACWKTGSRGLTERCWTAAFGQQIALKTAAADRAWPAG
jgi:hypothetical protein